MINDINYFVGGYFWGENNRKEDFLKGGYWEIGGDDKASIRQIKKTKEHHRIALKTTNIEEQELIIRALGVVKLINPKNGKQVFVNWKLKNVNRILKRGLGEYAKRVHGPIKNEKVIKQIFKL